MSDPFGAAPNTASAVLLVEDDENLRLALADNLEDEGYAVETAATAAAARQAFAGREFDVVILDIMLPDGDGYGLCRELRATGAGSMVLMLTARTLEEDVVRGFEVGADDYLAKPYRLRELLARVKALCRRRAAAPRERLDFAGFSLDRAARVLTGPDGTAIDLTRTEFDLLAYFLANVGRALPRDEILEVVWGDVAVEPRTVDNFVSSLKKKLGWTRDASWRMSSVRGVGYRMELDS